MLVGDFRYRHTRDRLRSLGTPSHRVGIHSRKEYRDGGREGYETGTSLPGLVSDRKIQIYLFSLDRVVRSGWSPGPVRDYWTPTYLREP